RSPDLVELVLEGGPLLGFGHAGRCLALWEELAGCATFRVPDPAVSGFLKKRGASVGGRGEAPIVVLARAVSVTEAEVHTLHREGRRVVLIDDLGSARMLADVVV